MIRSSFPDFNQRRWWQFQVHSESDIGEWWLMIEFELDIPSLSEEGIEMEYYKDKLFEGVRELHSSSMIDWLILIEMLILLNITLQRIVMWLLLNTYYLFIHQHSGYLESIKWKRYLVLLNRLWFKEKWEWGKNHSISLIFVLSSLLKWVVMHSVVAIQ